MNGVSGRAVNGIEGDGAAGMCTDACSCCPAFAASRYQAVGQCGTCIERRHSLGTPESVPAYPPCPPAPHRTRSAAPMRWHIVRQGCKCW
jgi:hypothetical protein